MKRGWERLWIVVANGSRARLMRAGGQGGHVDTVETLEASACREHGRQLVSDKPGRSLSSGGPGRHGMESPTDPHRVERDKFARALVDAVEHAHAHDAFEHLVLIAPAQMLGSLRGLLRDPTRATVILERPKDITALPESSLQTYLADMLADLQQRAARQELRAS